MNETEEVVEIEFEVDDGCDCDTDGSAGVVVVLVLVELVISCCRCCSSSWPLAGRIWLVKIIIHTSTVVSTETRHDGAVVSTSRWSF